MSEKRVIKRYSNRKLYDKRESRYVTLEEIAKLVRAGEDIQVIDNETEEDLTAVTFAQIILEEEKRKTHLISTPFLRRLIRSGEARMQDLSDRATRSIEAIGEMTEKAGVAVREAVEGSGRALGDRLSLLEDLLDIPQKRLDALREAARKSIGRLRSNPVVRKELERIAASLHTLEEAIARVAEEEKGAEGQQAAGQQAAPEQAGEAAASRAEPSSEAAGSQRAEEKPAEEERDQARGGESQQEPIEEGKREVS
ncbi:MAG: hypothetical protein D6815_05090 [Candidatus Dadabacteria bacterium]|nr:MAG: hypothetical protein D6815_05090 [Candidatus Dadabacteria bacterium]